jgi:hypothetical protein
VQNVLSAFSQSSSPFLLPPSGLRLQAKMMQTHSRVRVHLLALCGQPADECLLNSAALDQNGSNLNDTNDSNNHQQNDWVRFWMRNVDAARASQPHFVSPIVTTHVMLVQQYRYDMSWQQDPSGGTVTSNYGASRGLEIIPTTRLEVGIFPPGYFVHQSKTADGFGDLSWQVKYRGFREPGAKATTLWDSFLVVRSPRALPRTGWATLC